MPGEHTSTTLNALFKHIYAANLKYLPPKGQKLIQLVDFVPADRMPGNFYNQPVVTRHEQGFTYAAAGTDAFTVSEQINSTVLNAQVLGGQILLQSVLGYEVAARASSGGRRAFIAATKFLVESMVQSMRKRLEIELMYGQDTGGIGVVSAYTAPTITLTTASFAPGIWAGMEGARISVFNSTMTTLRGTETIASINLEARTVTLAAGIAGTVATDVITFAGQATAGPVWATVPGLHRILTATTSLFGIDPATTSLWRASNVSAGNAALSHATIQKAVAAVVGKGGEGDYVLICHPTAWANLASTEATYRRYVGAENTNRYATGTQALEYYAQAGEVTIIPSIYCKEGFAYLINPDDFTRIGATDITFNLPDRGDEYFFHLATVAAYALRAYSNQALFCEAPGRQCIITAIVNS